VQQAATELRSLCGRFLGLLLARKATGRLADTAVLAAADADNLGVDGSADGVVHLAVELRERVRCAERGETDEARRGGACARKGSGPS
jgi:hypothetical protein